MVYLPPSTVVSTLEELLEPESTVVSTLEELLEPELELELLELC